MLVIGSMKLVLFSIHNFLRFTAFQNNRKRLSETFETFAVSSRLSGFIGYCHNASQRVAIVRNLGQY